MQGWRKAITRSWIGSGVLLAAFLIHILLALYKLSRRLTWKLPLWEAAQILTGLSIPLFLITHVVYNRGAATLAGTDDTYAFELGNIWPGLAWEHSRAAAGRVGARLHRHALLAEPGVLVSARAAGAVCACRGAAGERARGLHGGGSAGGGPARGAGRLGEAAGGLARAGCSGRVAPRPRCTTGCASRSSRCWASPSSCPMCAACAVPPAPRSRSPTAAGRWCACRSGPTLLEISRMSDVPHASVCGGRARCSTCRVGVESGLADLHAAGQRRGHDARQHHGAAARAARLPDPPARGHHGDPPRRAAVQRQALAGGRPAIRRGSSATWPCCSSTSAASPGSARTGCPTTWCSFSTGCSPRWARPSSATTAPSTSIWATA